ncbi:MAG TPA: 4Fe-4S binding protein [Clostridiaceae bacterium]|nr:4Fe-4S binding protein [Clostridiaceae bacterium]
MKIAVLSGKGGTGKTLAAVNLAAAAGHALYLDCDVEEPNGHLFFKPENMKTEEITVRIPVVDQDLCTGCRDCVEFCRFNALAHVGGRLLIFEEICHSCGGCILVCPEKALTEKDRVIGVVRRGDSAGVRVHSGILNPGEESGVPLVQRLFEDLKEEDELQVFIDGPPGTSCVVMETVTGADYCLLVAEPTLFGAHNLEMIHGLVKLMGKPLGVLLNKCLEGDNPSEEYCLTRGIPILGRIPFDPDLGRLNSEGEIAVRPDERYRELFLDLLLAIEKEAVS